MLRKISSLFIIFSLLILSACTGSDPGPLAGTWRMGGLVPMTIQFRSGETETLGVIEKVSYKVKGNDVLVTYTEGLAKGMTMRYTITGQNTAQTEMGTLQRIQ
ncbi:MULTISPECIES: hypothetical protein [unclassified Methylophilus]|uniref:hypothetical protein n=1 Tax=unclassified Methylophilus TaxID=2630143 RepID=UPI001E4AB61A|nr:MULTISPECIES: hypothetical protein [unclassified Methylophilus]